MALRFDGSLVWCARLEVMREETWTAPGTFDLVARDASGRELWRRPSRAAERGGALAIGDVLVQPDLDS